MAKSDQRGTAVSASAAIDDDIADEAVDQTDQISAINQQMDDLVADLQRNT